MQQPTTYVLELDEEEKKLLAGWMMVVHEQLTKKDKTLLEYQCTR
jgi:hypothetical protein